MSSRYSNIKTKLCLRQYWEVRGALGCQGLSLHPQQMSRSINWHYFLTSVDFYLIPLADELVHRMSWWNRQRKGREKTENILAGCIKLSYATSMFYLCQQIEKKGFWNHSCNLLASTKTSVTSQRTENIELVNEMPYVCVCIHIYTVGSNREARKHVGQAEFVKLKLHLLPFPILSFQIIR